MGRVEISEFGGLFRRDRMERGQAAVPASAGEADERGVAVDVPEAEDGVRAPFFGNRRPDDGGRQGEIAASRREMVRLPPAAALNSFWLP